MGGVLVHEWIARAGGSENVLEALADLYPHSDILCLWNESSGRFDPERVRESVLARTPLRHSKALALPAMPAVWRHAPDRDYDWALISSHLFAHHARFPQVDADDRFVYVHSPARYLWEPALDRRGSGRAVRVAARAFTAIDRARARETRHFAANSVFVRDRMDRAWGVPARVIPPPVDVTRIRSIEDWADHLDAAEQDLLTSLPDDFVLGASRFIPYKRLEEAIRAGEVTGRPVVIAGAGPEEGRLRARAAAARVPVHLVLSPSTPLLYALYRRAAVYVFAAIEDFGIMPVEAAAAGAPVVANVLGGARESVVQGVTGALATFDSDIELASAVELAASTDPVSRRRRAEEFSVERFRERIRSWVGR